MSQPAQATLKPDLVSYIRSPQAIRERSKQIFDAVHGNRSEYFTVNLEKLGECAAFVVNVTRRRFPTLAIPEHGRWSHFDVGDVPRLASLEKTLQDLAAPDRARSLIDLVIVSVLLDAGAGATWRYTDHATGIQAGRSEGLAVASLRMFERGDFSDRGRPEVTARGLQKLSEAELAEGFQASDTNQLEGLSGRCQLLKRLAEVLEARSDLATPAGGRPGAILDLLAAKAVKSTLPVTEAFSTVLDLFTPIWPAHKNSFGVALGDVWEHPFVVGQTPYDHLVPFHKLSLWLTASLVRALRSGGLIVSEMNSLPGLAEYRNGGLFVDCGVIALREPKRALEPQLPGAEMIIEWRALTVTLLDLVAAEVRKVVGLTEQQLPLVSVLEGGTWAAGREVAKSRRADGSPPIAVQNLGNVF